RFLMATAAAAIVMVACNNEETDNWAGEIRLSSGLAVQQVNSTRAANNIQNGQFAAGEKIDVFINEAVATDETATTSYTQPLVYTAGGDGSMSTSPQPYYPTSGKDVNIYAYYPSGTVTSIDEEQVDFEVVADQSSDDAYRASDLMYGTPDKNPVGRTKNHVNITFKHLLSKVTVTLISGVGTPDLTGAKVELLNVLPTTKLYPSKGTIDEATGTQTEITVMDKGTNLSGSAVVVPQTLNQEVEGKRRFIRVTLETGGVLYSQNLKDSEDKTIEDIEMTAGNEYKYEITVNLTSLDIKSSITEWSTGDPVRGEAEME
uniref:fimbrillin family protein n=1 Tax=Bacteroides cellulosilyticus TaxID=246787 RepID=UPI0032EC882F